MTRARASRDALVVVDMQNAFCDPGGAVPVPEAHAQLPRVAEAIALARDAGIAVIYTAVEWAGIDEVPPRTASEQSSAAGGMEPVAQPRQGLLGRPDQRRRRTSTG
jgi:nicotinamidase-related amidase